MLLSREVVDFLAHEMCIDTQDLVGKIFGLECSAQISGVCEVIQDFYTVMKTSRAEEDIRKIFQSHEQLICDELVYEIADPLRHAFASFASGGLHQLFTRQENEAWYPRVVLTRELRPNDIATLDELVTVYRGCDLSEYQCGTYGQSWTTSEDVAKEFAYSHYLSQRWFDPEKRAVLRSVIPRAAIFYSDQKIEFEVVVDVKFLDAVFVHA